MYPTYPTLTEMVALVTTEAHRAAGPPVDAAEFDRYAHRVLVARGLPRPGFTGALAHAALDSLPALLRALRRQGLTPFRVPRLWPLTAVRREPSGTA